MTNLKAVVGTAVALLIAVGGFLLCVHVFSNVEIKPGFRDVAIRFRVSDAATGKPIANATLAFVDRGGVPDERLQSKTATSDAQGTATVVRKDTATEDFICSWGRYRTTVNRNWGIFSVQAHGYEGKERLDLSKLECLENGMDPATGAMRFDVPIKLNKRQD